MATTDTEIYYPSGDGRPVAETPTHRDNLLGTIAILQRWYAGDAMTYVSGNMFLYYIEGEPRKCLAPDVFVVHGVPRDKPRDVYQVWMEDGRVPDVVIEFTSRSTRDEDMEDKFHLYRDVLRVSEYFLFDPYAEYLEPRLSGYCLQAGRYVAIEPVAGRLPSRELRLHLEASGSKLRLFDPLAGRWLPSAEEARAEAEANATRAEAHAAHAETERFRAEARAAHAEAERSRAEAKVARADAKAAHAEMERSRAEAKAARADAIAAHAEMERSRAEANAARADAKTAHAEMERSRAEANAARADAKAARAEADRSRAEAESCRLAAALQQSQSEAEQLRRELAELKRRGESGDTTP